MQMQTLLRRTLAPEGRIEYATSHRIPVGRVIIQSILAARDEVDHPLPIDLLVLLVHRREVSLLIHSEQIDKQTEGGASSCSGVLAYLLTGGHAIVKNFLRRE